MSCLRHKVCRMLNLNQICLSIFLTYNSKRDNDCNNDNKRSCEMVCNHQQCSLDKKCENTGFH